MPIFFRSSKDETWLPTPQANGPFKGLQGGAVAGLLVAEIEAASEAEGWGVASSVSAWFLKPIPNEPITTRISEVSVGRRVSVIDNSLFSRGSTEPCAVARVTMANPRNIRLPNFVETKRTIENPGRGQLLKPTAPHGGAWFMDTLEVRHHKGIPWFRLTEDIIEGAGTLSRMVGPADWAHGINRPVENALADPNPNLTVQLLRPPVNDWVGLDVNTQWHLENGTGIGGGLLYDVQGIIGRVSMSVVLTKLQNRNPKT